MIITGTEKEVEKKLQDKTEILRCYEKYNKNKKKQYYNIITIN